MSTKCALHTLLQILLMLRVISTPFRQFRLRPLATHSTNTVCYCFTLTTPDTKNHGDIDRCCFCDYLTLLHTCD
uniref:Putative secreted protein n=1 Tax=Anopheles darlingi TaxID=43151 RepID=A0A2M4D1A6_ANODA